MPRTKTYTEEQRIEKRRAYARKYASEHRDFHRNRKLRYKGFDIEKVEKTLKEQNGLCAICRLPERYSSGISTRIKALALDHNHTTGKMRGLLCQACNVKLGVYEQAGWIEMAEKYLEKYK